MSEYSSPDSQGPKSIAIKLTLENVNNSPGSHLLVIYIKLTKKAVIGLVDISVFIPIST